MPKGREQDRFRALQCGYSPKHRLLNLFQKDSLKALADAHARQESAGLIILPPGSGKTRIAAEDAKKCAASRVLYIAHTKDILDVAQSEFEAVFSTNNVKQYVSSTSLANPAAVNIATIQLISKNPDALARGAYDYLVIDEFHHAAAATYRKAINACKPQFLLGLTATPFRGDRQDIYQLCNDNVLASFELRTGIDAGILSPYHYFGCFDDVDYSSIKHSGRHYDVRDLERALVIPQRDRAVIAKWKELAEDKPRSPFVARMNMREEHHWRSTGLALSLRFTSLPRGPVSACDYSRISRMDE